MAGLKDVAERAGVSITTASHVLNNTRRVSDELKRRVEQAADELNYHPNLLARGLKTRRTNLIGLVIPDLYGSYFPRLVASVEEELDRTGHQILLCHSQGRLEKEQVYLRMLSSQVDGLLIAPAQSGSADHLLQWNRQWAPMVFIDRRPPSSLEAPYAVGQNFEAGVEVCRHLADKFDELAVVSPHPAPGPIRERIDGFVTTGRRLGKRVHSSFLGLEEGRAAGVRQMERILSVSSGTVGVFCTTNSATSGCVSYLQSEGINIGAQVGVVGYDDSEWMTLTTPSISAVRTNPELIGKRACQMMMNLLNGDEILEGVELPSNLIIRESSVPKSVFR
jgi:LacI family transcriptional regulator